MGTSLSPNHTQTHKVIETIELSSLSRNFVPRVLITYMLSESYIRFAQNFMIQTQYTSSLSDLWFEIIIWLMNNNYDNEKVKSSIITFMWISV